MGPFEGNWQPDVTPKEQLGLEQRGLAPPSQSDLKNMIHDQVENVVEWHMYKWRVKHAVVHSIDKRRCIFDKSFISNLDALQDELCFILDLESFFINKTFHVRELGYYTWNQEHGRHAFFIPLRYKTLNDKEKRTVHFVCNKIHGSLINPPKPNIFKTPWY